EGGPAFGSTISFLSFTGQNKNSQGAINEFGQIIFPMTLANGTQLLARFTPEIHFRNASGGSWNTNTNWTVGIKPGAPNDTFIDPPSVFSTTVTGPSSDVTIKSLTVAGRNGATAQLNLNGGATVEVLGGVTIGST